jgi:catechol 2,3-dioxygenase-like lactoylglutathione lyase family enzyme
MVTSMPFARLVPELYCSDVERSMSFYVDVLGFTVRYARPFERFAYLDRQGAEIMLEQPTGRTFLSGELEHPYWRGVNFQIQVGDVESLYAAVQASSCPVFLELEDRWYRRDAVMLGNRQFIVQDPDGYLLRFFEDLGMRPASPREITVHATAGSGCIRRRTQSMRSNPDAWSRLRRTLLIDQASAGSSVRR